ncbi:hypothetical protein D3C85_1592340 [compost metagenome]
MGFERRARGVVGQRAIEQDLKHGCLRQQAVPSGLDGWRFRGASARGPEDARSPSRALPTDLNALLG